MNPLSWMKAPPSVLPDISPSRGEIGQQRALWAHSASSAEDISWKGEVERALHPLSPLVGEMSGRTEGGISK